MGAAHSGLTLCEINTLKEESNEEFDSSTFERERNALAASRASTRLEPPMPKYTHCLSYLYAEVCLMAHGDGEPASSGYCCAHHGGREDEEENQEVAKTSSGQLRPATPQPEAATSPTEAVTISSPPVAVAAPSMQASSSRKRKLAEEATELEVESPSRLRKRTKTAARPSGSQPSDSQSSQVILDPPIAISTASTADAAQTLRDAEMERSDQAGLRGPSTVEEDEAIAKIFDDPNKDRLDETKRMRCIWPGCSERLLTQDMVTHVFGTHAQGRPAHPPGGTLPDATVRCEWPGCTIEGTPGEVMKHMNQVHRPSARSGVTKFICQRPACNGKVLSRTDFTRHVEDTHFGLESRKPTCPICSYRLRQDMFRNRHHLRDCVTKLMSHPWYQQGRCPPDNYPRPSGSS